MDKLPSQFRLNDVTERTELHAEMNRHLSWAISLAITLDLPATRTRLVELRSFLAGYIDQRAKELRKPPEGGAER